MKATVIRRTVAATPQRDDLECWQKIVSILAPDANSTGRKELEAVAGVAAAVIASEASRDDAFYVYGSGPQIRVYCLFGEAAITGDGVDESALFQSATEGDWRMSMPCLAEDLDWIQRKLTSLSNRVSARAAGEEIAYEDAASSDAQRGLILNCDRFRKS